MENIQHRSFWRQVLSLALPVAAQGLLYSVLAIVNQIMVGREGDSAVVAVAMGSKLSGVLFFTISGLTAGLGILAAQHIGNRQPEKIAKLQGMMLSAGLLISLIFTVISLFFPEWAMRLFTADPKVIAIGMQYHRYFALSYLPACVISVYSTTLRSAGIVKMPMFVSLAGVPLEGILDYLLIFGNFGFPRLEAQGSGLATTIAVWLEFAVIMFLVYRQKLVGSFKIREMLAFKFSDPEIHQLWRLTLPLLGDCVSFTLTDNISGAIYGYMGTTQTIAVTLMMPIQMLLITFFSGFGTAASVMIGHRLGRDETEHAYMTGKRIIWLSLIAPLAIGLILLIPLAPYLSIYHLSVESLQLTRFVMLAMVLFIPFKVLNMVLGSVLGAGGETKFIFLIGILGGWVFAVPLGLLTAFVLHWNIVWVFVAISLEELIRFVLGIWKIRTRTWLNNLVKGR